MQGRPSDLSTALPLWERITSDQLVLSTIAVGYVVPLSTHPPLSRQAKGFKSSLTRTEDMDIAIKDLIAKDAVEVAPDNPGFYSGMFLRRKASGEWRPIFNLKQLNRYVHLQSFSLLSPVSVRDLFPEFPCWGALVDLKDAYFHVIIHRDSRHLLRFCWDGIVYQYRRLPFGLRSAPYIFSRVMKPVIGFLQSRGIRIIPYLDDWLFLHKDRETLQHQVSWAVKTMVRLGLIISPKSLLTPVQTLSWLGVLLDLNLGRFGVPQEKQVSLQNLCRSSAQKTSLLVKEAQALLGSLNFFAPYIHLGRLKMRPLQMWCIEEGVHNKAPSASIPVSEEAKQALRTWADPTTLGSRVPIHTSTVEEATVTTDASKIGWGGHCGQLETAGQWPKELKKWSINALEMKAVYLTLLAFRFSLQHHRVKIQSDNSTTVSYINKQGGTRSRRLLKIAQDIWEVASTHNMTIRAAHLAGKSNLRADALSRMKTTDSEWSLHPLAFQKLQNRWGQPKVDLFASQSNAKVASYVTIEENSLSLEWSTSDLLYAFPPYALIPQVLTKLTSMAHFQILIVVPDWRSRPWYPILMEMSKGTYMDLSLPDIPPIYQVINGKEVQPENLNFRILGVKLWK